MARNLPPHTVSIYECGRKVATIVAPNVKEALAKWARIKAGVEPGYTKIVD
jgi:hypothetical protein